ncbi:aspartate aminotransferase family protein [Nocardia rhamnosiphila]|uniref:Aspartate aminotransferase family protein n=1 Tax=Nocardia rhamnosiphila TaxID=426716 RepID=A0ABV2WXQ1_9NOCA
MNSDRQKQHWDDELIHLGPGTSEAVAWAGLVIENAEGAHLTDIDGHRYLDLMGGAGVNLLGHSHPQYLAAMHAQMNAWMIGAHGSAARLAALRGLAALLPRGLARIQFYSGGAEAVESAIRLAKSVTGKFEILSFWRSFHGRTAGALAVTGGGHLGYGPTVPGVHTAPYAYCYRCPLRATYPGCGFGCIELARNILREQSAGALAAVLVEPIQGRAGNIVPPPGYLKALRELADEYDALLIADESMTGLGRTGTVLSIEHDDVHADIVILGKGMGNGYPVTAIAAPASMMDSGPFSMPSASSSSFGGFPLACAAAASVTSVIRDQQLPSAAAATGATFLEQLRGGTEGFGVVGQVRGQGLAIGIELVADPGSREPLLKSALRPLFEELLQRGILVMFGGNSIRLYPPLTVTGAEMENAASIIIETLGKFDRCLR